MLTTIAWIDRFLAAMGKVFFVAANTMLIIILVINIANISSRFFFGRGLIWVFPWTTVLFVWMVFLGFYVIYHRNRDIKVDILYKALPTRVQNGVTIFTNLVVMGLMVVILVQIPALLPRQVGNMDYVGLQRYWLAVPFYASCGLVLVEFLRDTLWRALYGPPPEDDAAPAEIGKGAE